jgi:hypothetical protein
MDFCQVKEASIWKLWLNFFAKFAWNELYQDWLWKMVDRIKLGMNGLMRFPGTIPVGGVAGFVPQDPAGISVDEQATGVPMGITALGSAVLVGTVGNSQPAEVLVGNTVFSVSVWKGLCIPLDPA